MLFWPSAVCHGKLLIGFMYLQNIPFGSIDSNKLPAYSEHILSVTC